MKDTAEKGLAIGRFFGVLIKRAKYIILITVTFALIGALVSTLFTTAVYQAQAKMIVNVSSGQNGEHAQWASSDKLTDTCAIVVRSRNVLQPVIDALGLPDTFESLMRNVKVESVKDTPVMQITVKYGDPEVAKAITAKILEVAPAIIVDAIEVASVKTVEDVHGSSEPVSASLARYVAIFGAFGFVLSCALFVMLYLMDNTFRSEKEISQLLNLPVLGVIPSVESCLKISANSKK